MEKKAVNRHLKGLRSGLTQAHRNFVVDRNSDGFFILVAPAARVYILEANRILLRRDSLNADGDRPSLVLCCGIG